MVKAHTMTNSRKSSVHLILPLFIYTFITITTCQAQTGESNEQLYRRTVNNWRSKRSYQPWEEYTVELLNRWQSSSSLDSNSKSNRQYHQKRLEIVGGFEEGILAIEKATVARGEGQNVKRDQILSQLYCAYGKVLLDLTPLECHNLALDPHTLLIGIETVSKSKNEPPSTFLCKENAENALRNAATLDATNTLAADLLEGITGGTSAHERKPKEFVAELFDSFADSFDEKLVVGLGYVVPKMVGDAAKEALVLSSGGSSGYGAVLDAGCGTGLAGRYLRPLIVGDDGDGNRGGVMIGVDASKKMLDIASKCTTTQGCGLEGSTESEVEEGAIPLYDDLLALDLEEMTLQNTLGKVNKSSNNSKVQGFDLIVAADVLVYFGSISSLLATFAQLSLPGATLVFSCERATEEEAPLGWRLLSSGRFAHTKKHALDAGFQAGWKLVEYKEIVPRMERGEEVQGHLFTFVLNEKDGDEL